MQGVVGEQLTTSIMTHPTITLSEGDLVLVKLTNGVTIRVECTADTVGVANEDDQQVFYCEEMINLDHLNCKWVRLTPERL